MQYPLTIPFYFGGPPPSEDSDGCWIGLLTEFEIKLLQPMATYPLEQLRQRFLFALTYNHDLIKSARVLLQMAFEIDTRSFLNKLIDLPLEVPRSKVCERRRFLEIDRDMRLQRYLIGPALESLATIPTIPVAYIDLVRRYAVSDYARYRTCALAAAICMAKAVQ